MRRGFLGVGTLLLIVFPSLVDAQSLVPCDGVNCGTCEFVDMVQRVYFFLVGLASILATIVLVYAGLRLVTAGGDVQAKEEMKGYLTNIVIGLILVIASYAIIATVINALAPEGSEVRAWQRVQCIYAIVPNASNQVSDSGGVSSYTPNTTLMPGNCSPENFLAQGATQSQANTLSCIAGVESACNSNADNSKSSARGILQVTRGWNDPCHNLNITECSEAVGYTGDLNCSRAFGSGGRVIAGQEELARICDQAASNDECNIKAGLCLLNGTTGVPSGYTHWTSGPGHTGQQACVAQYAN